MGKLLSRIRSNRKRIIRCALGLLFVAGTALVMADLWHQRGIQQEVDQLREVISQVQENVQGGLPAAAWHESRVKGSNGWPEVSFLWDAGAQAWELENEPGSSAVAKTLEGRLWLRVEELEDYFGDRWVQPEPEDSDRAFVPRTVPTPEELRALLDATESIPTACQKAGQHDCITPVPRMGTCTEDWKQSLGFLYSSQILGAMAGRIKALVALEEFPKAESELLTYARFWSKHTLPPNYFDGCAVVSGSVRCLQLASELYADRKISDEAIHELLSLPLDGDHLLFETMAGDTVWGSLTIQRDGYSLCDASWFEWFSDQRSTPPGWGGSGFYQQFGQRAEYVHEMSAALLYDLHFLRLMRDPKPLDEVSELDFPTQYHWGWHLNDLPKQSIIFRQIDLWQLALKLQLLQRTSGTLADQKAALEATMAAVKFASHRWEGSTLILTPLPMVELPSSAPPDARNLGQYWEVRIEPEN